MERVANMLQGKCIRSWSETTGMKHSRVKSIIDVCHWLLPFSLAPQSFSFFFLSFFPFSLPPFLLLLYYLFVCKFGAKLCCLHSVILVGVKDWTWVGTCWHTNCACSTISPASVSPFYKKLLLTFKKSHFQIFFLTLGLILLSHFFYSFFSYL